MNAPVPTFGKPTPPKRITRALVVFRAQVARDLRSEEARMKRTEDHDDGWARARAEARASVHRRYLRVLNELVDLSR